MLIITVLLFYFQPQFSKFQNIVTVTRVSKTGQEEKSSEIGTLGPGPALNESQGIIPGNCFSF